jgi:FtsZ-binding cell division protein ZapB
MVKEIDTLKFEVSELRKENNDLQQGTHFQSDEIARLSMTVKLLNKEKE